MGNLLNKNQKEETITAEESTILQCKISRDNIKNYIKRLEKIKIQIQQVKMKWIKF